MNLVLLFVVVPLIEFVKSDIDVTSKYFKQLPPIFSIDNQAKCQGNYCRVSLILHPEDVHNKSGHWNVIEQTLAHSKFYNHNELFHALCISQFCPSGNLTKCLDLKYKHLGLKSVIAELDCKDSKYLYKIGVSDAVLMFIIIFYVAMVVYVSCKDHRKQSGNFNKFENTLIRIFSLKSNWKKLSAINDRPDFQKLKFIQGIRFYNMLLVIFCHTVCSYIGGYVSSTEYIELIYKNRMRLFVATLFVFLVQTFFLVSAFLLSYHVCQTMEVYKGSKLRYIIVTLINRYLRIVPPVFLMVLLWRSSWIARIFQGPIKSFYADREYERCQKNWWANILFISNHYDQNNMCYFITWYLSADTQLYAMSLLILWIIWKFRHKTKMVLILAIFMGIMIPTYMCYKYDLDMIYRMTPENSKNDHFRSFKFNAIYTSTYANMASYMVGLALGCFYFALENGNVILSKKHLRSLKYLFCTLPIAMVLISSYEYSRNITMVLTGLVRPLYALGIGAEILVMSQQKYGIMKTICELPLVQFLGNFTYSTYVVQFLIVFYRTAEANEPYFLSDFVLLSSFLQDAVLSIFCGFLMHIFVEMPALQLQKMFVPQIRQISYMKEK